MLNAYHGFRHEAKRHKDKNLRRAALEDAATVLHALLAIENGTDRNQFTSEQLDEVELDETGNASL